MDMPLTQGLISFEKALDLSGMTSSGFFVVGGGGFFSIKTLEDLQGNQLLSDVYLNSSSIQGNEII